MKYKFKFKKSKRYFLLIGIFILIIISFLSVILLNSRQSLIDNNKAAVDTSLYNIAVNTQNGTNNAVYAYGPSIIKENGIYYAFFCSIGGNGSWDYIRSVSSTNGVNWTQPVVRVQAHQVGSRNFAACDPSIVFFNGYYYLYYTDAYENPAGSATYHSDIEVARSASLGGQFLTFTQRGTWEWDPADPKILIKPFEEIKGKYGAGQTTLVNKNGTLYMWYTDDSYVTTVGSLPGKFTYLIKSVDPVNWVPNKTSYVLPTYIGSCDVKYNPHADEFVSLRIDYQHTTSSEEVYVHSKDGINWSDVQVVRSADNFPNFANNCGMSSDKNGYLLDGENVLHGFAAPPNFEQQYTQGAINGDPYWGRWNLYTTKINLDPYFRTTGAFDSATCSTISGWSFDPNAPNVSTYVHLYFGGPAGSGAPFEIVKADQNRPDVAAAVSHDNGLHGFSFVVPDKYKTGTNKDIYIYGIDNYQGYYNSVLQVSPKTINCTVSTPTPVPTSTFTPTITPTKTPIPTFTPTSTPVPTATAVPTATPTPLPTNTVAPVSCLCGSNNICGGCSNGNNGLSCLVSDDIYNTAPTTTDKNNSCKNNLRKLGDVNNDGVVNSLDYIYYVRVANGGRIPGSINPDVDGNGFISPGDRVIIINNIPK